MRQSLLALVASCAFLLALSPQAQTQAPAADARVIVKYKVDSPLLADQALPAAEQRIERARALGARVGLELRTGSGVSRRAHVVFAHGLTSVAGATGVPMAFGVLTTNSVEEALERAGEGKSNKGWEAAAAAVEMATVIARLRS